MIQIATATILSLVVSAANVNCVGRAFADMPTQNRADSISVAVPGLPRYSRKEMRVHRFLWTKWRQRRAATAELTFFGIDAGNVYTVNLKRNSGGRLVIEEYMRHYQAVGLRFNRRYTHRIGRRTSAVSFAQRRVCRPARY